jgi:hypothetical protein
MRIRQWMRIFFVSGPVFSPTILLIPDTCRNAHLHRTSPFTVLLMKH